MGTLIYVGSELLGWSELAKFSRTCTKRLLSSFAMLLQLWAVRKLPCPSWPPSYWANHLGYRAALLYWHVLFPCVASELRETLRAHIPAYVPPRIRRDSSPKASYGKDLLSTCLGFNASDMPLQNPSHSHAVFSLAPMQQHIQSIWGPMLATRRQQFGSFKRLKQAESNYSVPNRPQWLDLLPLDWILIDQYWWEVCN